MRRVRTQTSRTNRNTRVVAVEIFSCGTSPFVVRADKKKLQHKLSVAVTFKWTSGTFGEIVGAGEVEVANLSD